MVKLNDGASAYMWQDLWNWIVQKEAYPELFSFTTKSEITVQQAQEVGQLYEIFQLPLTSEAFQQYTMLSSEIANLELRPNHDEWKYIWGSGQFSVHKAYQALTGHMPTHHVFRHLWLCKCQPKHKIFFWLLLHDKLKTRDRLRRRHMYLETYTCENCILQKTESAYHLFLRCNFARRCWSSIGVTTPRISCP
jgi:hypothetical protein